MTHQDPTRLHSQDKNHLHHQNTAENYHALAANHQEQAAKSHLEAARLKALGNHEASVAHAMLAHAHTLGALRNSESAIHEHANTQPSVN